MTVNRFPFDVVNASDEQAHTNGMSNLNGTHSLESASANTRANRPLTSAPGESHTTLDASSQTTAQSAPHRAWEEGYQSPFSQTHRTLLDPAHNDAKSRKFQYHTRPPSISSKPVKNQDSSTMASDMSIQPALPLPGLALSTLPFVSTNPSANLQHSATTPTGQRSNSYQPRMRRVITKEMMLDDIDVSAPVTLGMSPFMPGQDVIANQNRFVRNECTFARHLLRLQHAAADSEARHAQTEQDIYEHLEQHRLALTELAGRSENTTSARNNTDAPSVRTDPDFLALEKAHQETCTRLEVLSSQVAESSESTQRTLIYLVQRLEQSLSGGGEAIN